MSGNTSIFFEDDEEEYDAQEAHDAGSMDPIEDGEYPWKVLDADITEAGSGAIMLELELKLVGKNPRAGLIQFDRIYMRGDSDMGRRIGRARYGSLCMACGLPSRGPEDIEEFVGNVVMGEVFIVNDEPDSEFRAKNEFKEYSKAAEADLESEGTVKEKKPKTGKKKKKKGKDSKKAPF